MAPSSSPTTASSHPHPSPWRQDWTSWHRGPISTQRALCFACRGLGEARTLQSSLRTAVWFLCGFPRHWRQHRLFSPPFPSLPCPSSCTAWDKQLKVWKRVQGIVGQGGSNSCPWQGLSIMKPSTEFQAGCQSPLPPHRPGCRADHAQPGPGSHAQNRKGGPGSVPGKGAGWRKADVTQ